MNKVAVVLLCLILAVLSFDAYRSHFPPSEQWEYRIEGFGDEVIINGLNVLGEEGWELASARRALVGEGSTSKGLYECIFKRKVPR